MNYTELKQAIQDWAENHETTFVNNIPFFVRQAERRIYNSTYIPALRKRAYANLIPKDWRFPLPNDFLAMFSVAIRHDTGTGHDYDYLIVKEPDFLTEAFPDTSVCDLPRYYAIMCPTEIVLAPTPDQAYQILFTYYYYPPSIVDRGVSWIGEKYDQLLLFASLKEANVFMKGEPDVTQLYEKQYIEALMQLQRMGEGLDLRDSFRSGQPRINMPAGNQNG